jgi:hypothetical protein
MQTYKDDLAAALARAKRLEAKVDGLGMKLKDQYLTIVGQAATIERLHKIIEMHWRQQAVAHMCGCSEWPECIHTLSAAGMRTAAMKLDAALNPKEPA